jgi:hypothetical protein
MIVNTTVLVPDASATASFKEMEQWARDNCNSFIGCEVADVSDFSYTFDEIAEFKFGCEKDSMWFRLKWEV